MRGVTSSSVVVADLRLLANSRTAARREWTVAANVHMAA